MISISLKVCVKIVFLFCFLLASLALHYYAGMLHNNKYIYNSQGTLNLCGHLLQTPLTQQ